MRTPEHGSARAGRLGARSPRRWTVGLATMLAATSLSPATASADEDAAEAADARKAYQEGSQAFQAKRYVEAAEKFEQAASKRPHGVPLFTAGLAWESAGQADRAAEAFHRALALPGLDPKQTEDAKTKLAALEKSIGGLEVTGEVGAQVRLGDRWEQEVPARLYAMPGAHTLVVRHPDGARETVPVKLEAGVVLPYLVRPAAGGKPAAAGTSTTEPAASPGDAPRGGGPGWNLPVGLGVAGVGVGVLGAAVVLGLEGLSARDAYDAAPTREAYDHASSLQTWTNVALITGGVLAVSGVALAVWPMGRSGSVRVGARPGGLVLGGTFQ